MNKNTMIRILSIVLIVFLTLITVVPSTISANPEGKIAESLLEEFKEKDKTTFLVYFKESADVEKAATKALQSATLSTTATPEATKAIKQKAVVSSLKETSEETQQSVLTYLEAATAKGDVNTYQAHYIVNIIVVTGTKQVAETLANYQEVKKILPSEKVKMQQTDTEEIKAQMDKIQWNVNHVHAPDVWKQGITGKDIVVASIDTGAQWDHPALKNSYRGYNPETGEVNHDFSWFDAAYTNSDKLPDLTPRDRHGHGTHVTGTMVGYDPVKKEHFGVAPGAKWIAVNAFDIYGGAWDHALIAAAEWILNPTNAAGEERPDLAPDIVNNSWGKPGGMNEFYREIVQSWVAAGIFPIFAAGNGLEERDVVRGSVEVPANYPESFAVGSTDKFDRRAKLSLLGPSPYGEIKPDVVAPGVEITSAYPGNRYEIMSGTSMAAPVVAGTVALLKEAAPDLTVEELKKIIKTSATPLTDRTYGQVPNNGFGYGLVNAAQAVEAAQNYQDPVQRIHGDKRQQTAVEISKAGWETADTVILTRADEFADALAAAPLAYQLDAPILLTRSNSIYEETLSEIERLGAENIILLGGEKAIEPSVKETLEARSLDVTRIGGSNRTITAALIAETVAPNGSERAFIVNGYDFPDALSVSSYAASEGIPILLTQEKVVPPATKETLSNLNIQETIVAGGPKVIQENLLKEFPAPTRIAGSDRYITNTELAKLFDREYDHLYIATGRNYADVLTGSVLAAKQNTGVLLVHRIIPENLKTFIKENGTSHFTIFGGPVAVNQEIEAELRNLLP